MPPYETMKAEENFMNEFFSTDEIPENLTQYKADLLFAFRQGIICAHKYYFGESSSDKKTYMRRKRHGSTPLPRKSRRGCTADFTDESDKHPVRNKQYSGGNRI